MDWNVAIERNREALRRILAALVAMAGVGTRGQFTFFPQDGAQSQGLALAEKNKLSPAPTLPRHLHRAILALLRPAEAAARRLVIVAARDLVLPAPRPRKAKPKPGSILVRNGKGTGIVLPVGVRLGAMLPGLASPRSATRTLALPLLDPLPSWPKPRRAVTAGVPRISAPGIAEPHRGPDRRPPLPGDPIDATRLVLRLQAVGRALDDLPAHARRFARWRVGAVAAGTQKQNHVTAGAQNTQNRAEWPRRVWPLRPGRPPGSRRRPMHEVHEVLTDLHSFAFWALEQFQEKCEAVFRPELRKDREMQRRDTS